MYSLVVSARWGVALRGTPDSGALQQHCSPDLNQTSLDRRWVARASAAAVARPPIPDPVLMFVNSCSPILQPSEKAQRLGQQRMSHQEAAANAAPREHAVFAIVSVDRTSMGVRVPGGGCGHVRVHILPRRALV